MEMNNVSNENADQATGQSTAEEAIDAELETNESVLATTTKPDVIAKKRLNSLKLKIHGEEVEEELPFDFDDNPEAVEYLTKQLQLSKAASRAMQENTTYKTQVNQFFQSLKSNTKDVLAQMGIDPKEFAASVIEEEIKRAQLSPEELERQELQEKLQNMEAENKRKEEEYNQKELSRLKQMEFERIDNQITSALDSSTVPKTSYTVRKIAEYMLAGAKKGYDLSPADVIPIVEDDIKKDLQEIINALGDDGAEEFIGKEVFERFRKKKLAKAKSTPSQVTGASVKSQIKDIGVTKSPSSGAQEKVDYKKFFGF